MAELRKKTQKKKPSEEGIKTKTILEIIFVFICFMCTKDSP